MADIRQTPVSNYPAYYGAGLLNYINEAASKPFGYENDPVRALTNLLGIPSAVKTLENTAYGMPNVIGSGMATQLRPEAKETVGNLLPMAPAAARLAAKGAVATGKGSFKYPQAEAFRLAQERAALPINKGGLGLPADNTAMDRAKAMGFNVPVYHGTNADIVAMSTAGKGKTSGAGAFVTSNPIAAETYLGGVGQGGNIIPLLLREQNLLTTNARGRNWNDIDTNILKSKGKDLIDILGLDRNAGTSTDELAMLAKDAGFSGIKLKNIKDLGPNSHVLRAKEYLKDKYNIYPDETWSNVSGKQFAESRDYLDKFYKKQKSDVTAINDADLLRSRFAAFDPFRKTSAIAATMGLAAPDLLAAEVPLGLLARPNVEMPKKDKRK